MVFMKMVNRVDMDPLGLELIEANMADSVNMEAKVDEANLVNYIDIGGGN